MKYLIINVKSNVGGKQRTDEVQVPYVLGEKVNLPKEFPFDQNIYFGPDSGVYLGYMSIDQEGNIHYVDKVIKLENGKADLNPFNGDRHIFHFEVIDK